MNIGDYFINGLAKIRESSEPIDLNNLIYHFKNPNFSSISLFNFNGPMHIFKSIHNGNTSLEGIEKEQIELKRDLGQIKQGYPKNRSREQEKTINNIKNRYDSREKVVQLFNDYAKNLHLEIFMI